MEALLKGECVSKQGSGNGNGTSSHSPPPSPPSPHPYGREDHVPKAIESMIAQTPNYKKFEAFSPSKPNDKLRVMLCGTYPIGQSNGYSRVVYYIAKYLGLKSDISLTIYGFQNYNQTQGSSARTDIPKSVILHDALAQETPKRSGFGEREIGAYLLNHPQDVVIIFNDMIITSALTQTIVQSIPEDVRKTFMLVSYMDQVYPYQKKCFIQLLNHYFDHVIAFTPYWMNIAKSLGLSASIQTDFFPHGFDADRIFPIPRIIARMYFSLDPHAFIILNLNRNQPRKRWDIAMMALAEVIERHQQLKKENPSIVYRPIKLMIGAPVIGLWDLNDILESELRQKGLDPTLAKEYLLTLARPQMLSDREINILYNACDIGLNTCEGEGFGLCQFEHAALGCPQVATWVGGFKEFLNEDMSILIEPKHRYYIDKQRDSIGGLGEVGDPRDFANGIMKYYTQPALLAQHGKRARQEIVQHYRWETVVNHFHRVLKRMGLGFTGVRTLA